MQSKRQQILEILKERKEATVSELARELKITSVTVRHHLDVLRSEGLVNEPKIQHRDSVGRPKYLYSLTTKADDYFPKNYAALTVELIGELKAQLPDEKIDAILFGLADRLAADMPAPKPGETLIERLDSVVAFLNQKGYMAQWEQTPEGYKLCTNNCPYETIAQGHPELCNTDGYLIKQLLGHPVEWVCHMHNGNNHCAYLISPNPPLAD